LKLPGKNTMVHGRDPKHVSSRTQEKEADGYQRPHRMADLQMAHCIDVGQGVHCVLR
jgi:hypothetical protein